MISKTTAFLWPRSRGSQSFWFHNWPTPKLLFKVKKKMHEDRKKDFLCMYFFCTLLVDAQIVTHLQTSPSEHWHLHTLLICDLSWQSCTNIQYAPFGAKACWIWSCFHASKINTQTSSQQFGHGSETSQTNANLPKQVHSQGVLERFSQWDISNQACVNIREDKIL